MGWYQRRVHGAEYMGIVKGGMETLLGVNRPIISINGKDRIDLVRLYKEVILRGGRSVVERRKLWMEVYEGYISKDSVFEYTKEDELLDVQDRPELDPVKEEEEGAKEIEEEMENNYHSNF